MKPETLQIVAEAMSANQRAIQALLEEASGSQLLTTEEYSKQYKLNIDTVRKQCRCKALTFGTPVKAGKRWMIECGF
jgi:hypothetical protein